MNKSICASAVHDTPDTDAVYAVIARCFGVARKQLTAKTSLVEDLGIDSIDLLALAVNLEEEFDVVITDRDLYRIRTIGDAILHMAGVYDLQQFGLEAAPLRQETDDRPRCTTRHDLPPSSCVRRLLPAPSARHQTSGRTASN